MRHRKHRKKCMFYPEDPNKANWDLFVTLILIFSCVVTPIKISLEDLFAPGWDEVLLAIDVLFLIDIIFIFNSAYYDEDFKIHENYKEIGTEYVKSWFLIDVLAIVPFDKLMMLTQGSSGSDINSLIRVVRIGRMYKLIKLTKLLRILKIVKERSKLFKYL